MVLDTPDIITEKGNITTIIDYDSTTTMYCEANGTPKPTIKWYTVHKNQRSILYNDIFVLI